MGHYKSNLRDIEFNLFEVLGRQDVLGHGPYEELDVDTAREMLKEVSRLAEHQLAESFVDADRNPPVFDPETHSVTMPASFARSYKAYQDSGFWSVDVNAELGGTVAPPSLKWAMNEMVLGANPAIAMFAASYAFGKLLHILGTPEQQKLARWVVEKGWHCTMVLTEPDAGSDVGAGRTRAVDTATERGTSSASSASSPAPSPTWSTTSSTSSSPAPRGPARAPRACRCSSSPSTTSTWTPASSASATAPT
jgi:alkylation response protein AidB-like acyl-CoA dehydrogenase